MKNTGWKKACSLTVCIRNCDRLNVSVIVQDNWLLVWSLYGLGVSDWGLVCNLKCFICGTSPTSMRPLIMWGPRLQIVWFIHKPGQLMKIHWRQRINYMWILRFHKRHIGRIVWLSELSVTLTLTHTHTNTHTHSLKHIHTQTHTHTHTSGNIERCCQLPIKMSFHCLKFCTLQLQWRFTKTIFLCSVNCIEASRCKVLLGAWLVKGRIRPHTKGNSGHFTIFKQH